MYLTVRGGQPVAAFKQLFRTMSSGLFAAQMGYEGARAAISPVHNYVMIFAIYRLI
jgi:hypothetical protein